MRCDFSEGKGQSMGRRVLTRFQLDVADGNSSDRLTQMKQEASNSNVFVCGQTQVVLGIDVDSHIVVSVGSDYLVNIWSTVTKVGRVLKIAHRLMESVLSSKEFTL